MSRYGKLSDGDIGSFLASHPGWEEVGGALSRSFDFDDYPAGVAFAVKVGFLAEAHNHHPDLQIGWRRARVSWSTHDAGGITALDIEMAERTDALAR